MCGLASKHQASCTTGWLNPVSSLDEQRIDDILVEINTVVVEIGKAQRVGAVDDE
jgi:hypothetical protein